jgi:hypothetical protein
MTCQTSRMIIATKRRMVAPLIRMMEYTTAGDGSIGVRPVGTRKVRQADNKASTTANAAKSLQRDHPRDSANDGSSVGAKVSALVIPARAELGADVRR